MQMKALTLTYSVRGVNFLIKGVKTVSNNAANSVIPAKIAKARANRPGVLP